MSDTSDIPEDYAQKASVPLQNDLFLIIFDGIKFGLYTIYYGKQNIADIIYIAKNITKYKVGLSEITAMGWNSTI